MNRFLKGIGIFLTLIVVGIVSAFAVIALLMRQEEVRVPDVEGKDIVSVIEIISQQGLQIKVDGREPSQSIPKDAVISQTPPPGMGIKKGRALHVVVSQGPSELLAPKVVGEQYRKAEFFLRRSGLPAPDVARTWSDTVERDLVISQDPPPGTPLDRSSRIGILVSLGKRGRVYVVPRLIGRRAEDAARAVDRMGLQYRIASRQTPSNSPLSERTVVNQKPLPGYPISADGVVELVMSR
jgi:beta-lactam-binding protein with PASTA domain